jgi:uncharacterized membrane protein
MNNIDRTLQYAGWGVYSLSGFIWAIFISWIIMASVHFAYPILHDVLDISQHTEKYGPQNRYRKHFQLTDKNERERLFSEINRSIHNNGEGLEDIQYHNARTGQPINTLLHRAEIIHLQDVAKLINVFTWVSLISLGIWLSLLTLYTKGHQIIPTPKQQLLSSLGLIGLSTLLILLIGPVKVFYAFHEWFFPANHQWFFYYQDSLMTILMKAPFLFGYIAILMLLIALAVFIVSQLAAHKWILFYNKRHNTQP